MTSFKSCVLAAALTAAALSSVDARNCGGLPCGQHYGRNYHRHSHYHPRPRHHRPSTIDLVSDMFSIPFYNTNTLFRQNQDQMARLKENSAPRYSIIESDDGTSFELSMEVPGVEAGDLTVEVENDNMLHIRGIRTIRESGSISKSEFDQSFHLEDIDIDRMTVSLSNGLLTVTAPKKEKIMKRIPLKIKSHSHVDAGLEREGVQEMGSVGETLSDVESGITIAEEELTITED